jgi:hypothetical protein
MKKEQYIPFDKEFLVEKQLAGFGQDKKGAGDMKKLFDILENYFHYEAFNLNRSLKQHYGLFDPDLSPGLRAAYRGRSELSSFKETLLKILDRGNYVRVDQEIIDEAFRNSDLIGLKITIDFNDFKEYAIFVRGHHTTSETVPRFLFFKKQKEFEYYDRVMIFLHYNDEEYFNKKKKSSGKMHFDPGCIVLKIFKRVPKNDLETIFPNAVPRMSNLDKILFWVPGIGGGLSLLITKVIPGLIAMYAAYKAGESLDLMNSKTGFYQGLIALGVLGGYLFRQYSSFVNKKIRFSKMLSDSLYFKNLGNNSGAFYSLLNSSEEEEFKETIMAYSFLRNNVHPVTAEELDKQIERWFNTELGNDLDFDVEDALFKLKNLGLGIEKNGKWEVLPVEKALERMDEIWDGIFNYNLK